MGAGAEVMVQGGHLMLKPLTPIPAMRRGLRLYPDDPERPLGVPHRLPRVRYGTSVWCSTADLNEGTATRLLMDVMSFERRPDLRNPRPWVTGGLAVGAAALAIRGVLHHRGSDKRPGRLRRAPNRPVQSGERQPRRCAVDSASARRSSRALAAKTSMSG